MYLGGSADGLVSLASSLALPTLHTLLKLTLEATNLLLPLSIERLIITPLHVSYLFISMTGSILLSLIA